MPAPKMAIHRKHIMNPMIQLVEFSIQSLMIPLINAPSVNPQLILNLCAVSITICNKYFNKMTPFNGYKIRLR